ncbi:MAG: prolyl oligopeptidase family serine peptidase [Deltaproteobacteria bacterium]|nr:prolyl oligopeptidase family serine peptidase [Deltaproteobacteria bacterium]
MLTAGYKPQLLIVVGLALAACQSETAALPADAAISDGRLLGDGAGDARIPDLLPNPPDYFGGDRPVSVRLPAGYRADQRYPLVFVLHGFSANGFAQETYLRYRELPRSQPLILVSPDGTLNDLGARFWNASAACCAYGKDVDDAGYLVGLLDEISRYYAVDKTRVYVVGHSNGGFMAYRLACQHADKFTAIVSLAGGTFFEKQDCSPARPVSVLQVHGTLDSTVKYQGGQLILGALETRYPGALNTVALWADYNNCTGKLELDPQQLDIDGTLLGEETRVERYAGCPKAGAVELWTIVGGIHLPNLTSGNFAALTWQWLSAQRR